MNVYAVLKEIDCWFFATYSLAGRHGSILCTDILSQANVFLALPLLSIELLVLYLVQRFVAILVWASHRRTFVATLESS